MFFLLSHEMTIIIYIYICIGREELGLHADDGKSVAQGENDLFHP